MTVKSGVAYQEAVSELKHVKVSTEAPNQYITIRVKAVDSAMTLWHNEGSASPQRAVTQRGWRNSTETVGE